MISQRVCAVCGRDISHRGENRVYCHPACKRKAQQRRRKERGAPLIAPPPVMHCLPCNKLACPTEAEAKAAKRAVEARTGRTNEVRYYRCPEGWWHWTRMAATLDGFRARRVPGETR